MRILFLITAFILLTGQTLQCQKIKGSDTMLPFSQQISEKYMRENPSKLVTVIGGGSGVGIISLIEGTVDIAQSSRKIKFAERQKILNRGKSIKEVVVAYDALAVIVNPSNKVKNLTRKQLEDIFIGKIKNWKEVGGEDVKIIPYARETSSGTYEIFKEIVLQHKNYKNGIMSMPATGAIIQSIKQTKGAIGYVGLAYVGKSNKTISISFHNGKFISPSAETVKNGSYPIVRPLYYYYISSSEKKVKSFIDYVLSTTGQSVISKVGFIPYYLCTNVKKHI